LPDFTLDARLRQLFVKAWARREPLSQRLQAALSRTSVKTGGKRKRQDLLLVGKQMLSYCTGCLKELAAARPEAAVKKIRQACAAIGSAALDFDSVVAVLKVFSQAVQDEVIERFPVARRPALLAAWEDFWLQVNLSSARGFLAGRDQAIAEKNAESSVLFHTAQSVSTELDLQSLLYKVVFHASMLLHVKQMFLFLAEPAPFNPKAERRLHLEAWNQAGQTYGEYSVRFGEGHIGQVAATRQAFVNNDYARLAQKMPFLHDVGRILIVPICFSDDLLGVLLAAHSPDHRHFTASDRELLAIFSTQIATTLKNVLLYQDQTRISRELEEKNSMLEDQAETILRKSSQLVVMNEVSQQVNSSLDLPEVLALLTRHAAESIGVDRSVVWLMEDKKVQMHAVAAYGLPPEKLGELSLFLPDIRRTRFFQVLSEQHAVEIAEGQDVELFQVGLHGVMSVRSLLAVPLAIKQQTIGLLTADDTREAHSFLEDEVNLVSAIANQAVLAIENARLYQQVKEQAITDGLTSLYNHRYFQLRFTEEFAHSKRYGNDLSIIMLDIDHFKEYNDTYGHIAGDLALKEIANLTRASVRENDMVARYGGEEFVIILPMTNQDGARVVAERIREAVRVCKFLGDLTAPQVSITVSLGIASYSPRHENRELLLKEADAALYRAKEQGRNQTAVFTTA
jgi:diguanylate cyclase (GGDEF)-like protein